MNGPAGQGAAVVALLLLATTGPAAAAALHHIRQRTRRERPIPGAGDIIGWAKTPAPAASPPPAPATTPAGPRHGGVSYSVRVWKCGRIRIWDGDGTLTYRHDCHCPRPDPWDAALERLIKDAR